MRQLSSTSSVPGVTSDWRCEMKSFSFSTFFYLSLFVALLFGDKLDLRVSEILITYLHGEKICKTRALPVLVPPAAFLQSQNTHHCVHQRLVLINDAPKPVEERHDGCSALHSTDRKLMPKTHKHTQTDWVTERAGVSVSEWVWVLSAAGQRYLCKTPDKYLLTLSATLLRSYISLQYEDWLYFQGSISMKYLQSPQLCLTLT